MRLELDWDRELVFAGRSERGEVTLDSAGVAGPSPVQALLYGLAGCMAMDVVYVLNKGRHDYSGLRVVLTATRQAEPPRRVTAVRLEFAVTGTVAPDHVERAIQLSRDKYCSVWHSMREDIPLETAFRVAAAE